MPWVFAVSRSIKTEQSSMTVGTVERNTRCLCRACDGGVHDVLNFDKCEAEISGEERRY